MQCCGLSLERTGRQRRKTIFEYIQRVLLPFSFPRRRCTVYCVVNSRNGNLDLAGTHRKRHALGLSHLQTFLDCLANITILSFSVLCYPLLITSCSSISLPKSAARWPADSYKPPLTEMAISNSIAPAWPLLRSGTVIVTTLEMSG